ncbi:adenylate/guanylate cyclase domain-containing protein [Granulosicoccus antarcticus]|uniref:Adenylate cyclase 1 n=1 Tax=Granulosicoccus antarcticus IMCC3135 TaxID=1192854 RepID=A0A2Z2NSD9_9GAMM|nr:adenylate/guanylate cyclase domain-containing protein [Granulosicoccus antarcticus]ASJ73425.1 Adenylate cyclase 1 [Granulosicoccus antarcticus IMCC3135]
MHTPTQTIELLREVHGILAEVIFRHDGTLDKYIGDGLMATFGTPEPSSNDASNALMAAIEMSNAFESWQTRRFISNGEQLKLAVGVHYGTVVIGDIGSQERLEFAVLGDAVNVASRLESATRDLGCKYLIIQELVDASTTENLAEIASYRDQLDAHDPIQLRGRSGEVPILVLR